MMFFNYGSAYGDYKDFDQGSSSTFTMRTTMDGYNGASEWKYIEVDYSSHFVMYSCKPILGQTGYNDYVWIWSRTPSMDNQKLAEIKARIQEKLPNYNLSTDSNMY